MYFDAQGLQSLVNSSRTAWASVDRKFGGTGVTSNRQMEYVRQQPSGYKLLSMRERLSLPRRNSWHARNNDQATLTSV